MMHKQSVNSISNTVLEQVFSAEHNYISPDGKQWVCNTCDRALSRGNMLLQAKANGLQKLLHPIPPELSGLNLLELRLISLRVPFMHYHLVNNEPYMVQQLMFHQN